MTLELFEELSDVLGGFIEKFAGLNIETNKHSLAWQRFHYNYFDSMTTTLYQSLMHINYATLKDHQSEVKYAQSFSLVLDNECKLIREVNFEKIAPEAKEQITKVLATDLPILNKHLSSDEYHYVRFNCLNRKDRLCALGGIFFRDSHKGELILNLFYLNLRNEGNDSLLEIDFYMKDKNKYLKFYNQLASNKINTIEGLTEFINDKELSLEEFNNDFIYFFGEEYLTFHEKRKYIRSLEMVFFTKNSFKEIADHCGYHSSEYLIKKYQTFESNGATPIIRYSNVIQA